MVDEQWKRYRRADRQGKLDLLRHKFSMLIAHADDGYEFLHIVLDDRAELKYAVNKAAVIGDDHSMQGFVRFVSALKEGETKVFAWVTAHGIKEWILSRGSSALYVDIPEFEDGFFIDYEVFRDECFSAYKKYYIWANKAKGCRDGSGLRPITGIRLSRLKDNWEECAFRYNVSADPDDWHDAVYRHYGDLPDGRHFGVSIWPKSEAWPPESAMMIVSKTGEMQTNTVIDDRWEADEADRWPLAAAASPSGKSIVWLKDGRIWVWREDKRDNSFWPDDGEELTDRIEGLPVSDALMRTDGILVLSLDSDEEIVYAYLCDEDIVLVWYEDCWVPANGMESPRRNEVFPPRVDHWPDSFAVMIRSEDGEYDYYSCGIRRVCFEPGLEVIKPGMLADNPDLESVTIPASVKDVQTWAFGCCTNLKDLVIEGDLSRVADWAPDAFDACACEEQYLRLREAHTGNQEGES